MNSPKFLTFCLALLLTGCGNDAQLKIQSLEAAVQQDKGTIAQLKEQEAKARIDFEALKTDRANAEAKIAAQTKQAGDASVRETLANEKILSLEKEREVQLAREKDYIAKLATAEARLNAFEAANAKAAQEAAEAASRSNLVVQIGLTMKSGETKPVSNTKVYLTRTKLLTLLPGSYDYDRSGQPALPAGIANLHETAAGAWHNGIGASSRLFGKFVPEIVAAVEKDAAFQETTDFNGRVSFEGIPPGEYFVLSATPLGGGAVLEKLVTVKGKLPLIAIGNGDILPEYR